MKNFFYALGLAAMLLCSNAMSQNISQRYPAGDVQRLEIKQESGKIYITGTDADYIHLQVNKVKGGIGCMTKVQIEDGLLLIKSRHAIFSGFTCEVEVTLELPRRTPLDARVGSSTLYLKNMDGPIKLGVGAGHVEGKVASNDMNIKLGAGRINLTLSEIIRSGNLNISVGAGVVDIRFPRGTVVNQNITNGFGIVNSRLNGDSSSGFKVDAKVAFGSIILDYL